LKVVVHIGDGKCGSSSVQASLYMASASLLEQGILYHAPAKTAGHFLYITLLNGSTRSDDSHQQEIARASGIANTSLGIFE
jgi:hypothetical protein